MRRTSIAIAAHCSSAAAREGGVARSGWTTGDGRSSSRGSPRAPRCPSVRCSASTTGAPADAVDHQRSSRRAATGRRASRRAPTLRSASAAPCPRGRDGPRRRAADRRSEVGEARSPAGSRSRRPLRRASPVRPGAIAGTLIVDGTARDDAAVLRPAVGGVDRRPGRADRRRSLDQPALPPALIHDRPHVPARWPPAGRCRFPSPARLGITSRFSYTERGNPHESHTARASADRIEERRQGGPAIC